MGSSPSQRTGLFQVQGPGAVAGNPPPHNSSRNDGHSSSRLFAGEFLPDPSRGEDPRLRVVSWAVVAIRVDFREVPPRIIS